jgi:GntR family galactonate operon transcriptional repressor
MTPVPQRKLKPSKIGNILRSLGIQIAGGTLAPGDLLPSEPDLERQFGASRTVIREAIKTLAAKGLVTVRQRHGTHVNARDQWSWLDGDLIAWISANGIGKAELIAFEEARQIIEPGAAALAAERATPEEKEAIHQAYRSMVSGQTDPLLAIAADKAFHLAILRASHNPVLQSLSGAIDAILSAIFEVTVEVFEGNLANHAEVANAIESGDVKLSRQAMERLLDYTGRFLS